LLVTDGRGVAQPLFSLRMSAAEFLQRWKEVQKQEANN
jgi:hypothetical protein